MGHRALLDRFLGARNRFTWCGWPSSKRRTFAFQQQVQHAEQTRERKGTEAGGGRQCGLRLSTVYLGTGMCPPQRGDRHSARQGDGRKLMRLQRKGMKGPWGGGSVFFNLL